jgi:hypothetical protein
VACAPLFNLQPVVLDGQLARFGFRPVDLHEKLARLELDMHQIERTGDHRRKQDQVQAGHAAVLSATRMMALRARALAATSSWPGRTRPSALNFIASAAQTARGDRTHRANAWR